MSRWEDDCSNGMPQAKGQERRWLPGLPLLGLLWFLGALVDRLWFKLDHRIPGWDQAEYMTGALNYWRALGQPHWLSGDWWREFWLLSAKIPPLTYILTAPFLQLFGPGPDQSTLVNLLLSAVLLLAVYGLGIALFSRRVGLWAAGLCLLLPGLAQIRLEFLTDYPLTALVTLAFFCLTRWRQQVGVQQALTDRAAWGWAIGFGFCFGLALMVKQPALLFLFTPLFWCGLESLAKRHWGRFLQLIAALGVTLLVCGPWYRTNWLIILTAGKRATIDSAIAEGDPPLNTLAAWTYYLQALPDLVSWPLLLLGGVGLLFYWKRIGQGPGLGKGYRQQVYRDWWRSLLWLLGFLGGAYLLCSLNVNKDDRYVMPYLPEVGLLLAQGLLLWPRSLRSLRWGGVGLAVIYLGVSLFPLVGPLPFLPLQHQAYLGAELPHREVISEVVKADPYLTSTIGVLPSTPQVNQHNVNYFGALQKFQVYGRQVGTRVDQVVQDSQTLSWFLAKTGDQGNIRYPAAFNGLNHLVQTDPNFNLYHSWTLPDRSLLYLYRQRIPRLEVYPLAGQDSLERVQLEDVSIPLQAPPGQPIPVTYQWSGPWQALRSGLVLLTWERKLPPADQATPTPAIASTLLDRWFHDHGIALGAIHPGPTPPQAMTPFRVVERLAMLPPANLAPGAYRLRATYLDRKTGISYPLAAPAVQVTIAPKAAPTPAPVLDRLTQLRQLTGLLPQGLKAFNGLFDQVGRLNQYDPTQDYLEQARLTWMYRLQQEPQNWEFAYGVALANVLQRRIDGSIAALEQLTHLDQKNPNLYAYLAFVNLYDFRPGPAQTAIKTALTLNPNLPELKALRGAASLMQGNLVQAWQDLRSFQAASQKK